MSEFIDFLINYLVVPMCNYFVDSEEESIDSKSPPPVTSLKSEVQKLLESNCTHFNCRDLTSYVPKTSLRNRTTPKGSLETIIETCECSPSTPLLLKDNCTEVPVLVLNSPQSSCIAPTSFKFLQKTSRQKENCHSHDYFTDTFLRHFSEEILTIQGRYPDGHCIFHYLTFNSVSTQLNLVLKIRKIRGFIDKSIYCLCIIDYIDKNDISTLKTLEFNNIEDVLKDMIKCQEYVNDTHFCSCGNESEFKNIYMSTQ
jgi:hypothetical protein